jgi:hypothetical protein
MAVQMENRQQLAHDQHSAGEQAVQLSQRRTESSKHGYEYGYGDVTVDLCKLFKNIHAVLPGSTSHPLRILEGDCY